MTRVDGLDRPVGHQTWNVDAHPEVLISRHSNHLSGIICREWFIDADPLAFMHGWPRINC